MLSLFPTFATVALLLSLSGVSAGPGANVFACLNTQHSSPPYTFPLDISFNIEKGECMGHSGHHSTVTATEPGQICTEIGYVEAKRGGICFMGSSLWHLAYETSNGTSGKVITHWFTGPDRRRTNTMDILRGISDDVMVCPTADTCEDTEKRRHGNWWKPGTQGPIHIVFNG
ncbi:MAG: hypothetical protein OHK93_004313 [Ramalina farinacea]|uniref:Uncharacterized protein n=1 Tax=Ramalina farinacea TaxID=258253 RepID=A0AA43TRZ7_9LECA|nr:hypothetical protein [Ramalina farinacea]